MPSLQASATQTAVLGTEHTLTTITTLGIYRLWVDAAALANGETLTIRQYYKLLTGGTERLLIPPSVYVNAQSNPALFALPFESDISIRYTLQQDGGTGRSYPWKVMAL